MALAVAVASTGACPTTAAPTRRRVRVAALTGRCAPAPGKPRHRKHRQHPLHRRAALWAHHFIILCVHGAQSLKAGPALKAPVFVDGHSCMSPCFTCMQPNLDTVALLYLGSTENWGPNSTNMQGKSKEPGDTPIPPAREYPCTQRVPARQGNLIPPVLSHPRNLL
jgi:hypothetical protein